MKKGDIPLLNQLVKTLYEAELKLREAYNKKNPEKFNDSKKLILKIQKQISEIIK